MAKTVEYDGFSERNIPFSLNIIRRAKEKIRILDGSLNPEFYEKQPIKGSLEEAVNEGVRVEIITNPSPNHIYDASKWKGMEVYLANHKQESCFMVVDRSHINIVTYNGHHSEPIIGEEKLNRPEFANELIHYFVELKRQISLEMAKGNLIGGFNQVEQSFREGFDSLLESFERLGDYLSETQQTK